MDKFTFASFRRLLVATLVLSAVMVVGTPVANAAIVSPLAKQYDKAVFGDFVIAGNIVTTCPTSAAWANPNCVIGRSSNSSAMTYYNDSFYMEYVDVDSDSTTFNSSTARITIPPGATIDYARLWWIGNTGQSVKTNGASWFACQRRPAQHRNAEPGNRPARIRNIPFAPTTHPIKFKFGTAAYQTVTPQAGHFFQDAAPTNGGRHYSASTDIKAVLSAQPTGVPIDLTVANIWTPKGNNCTGGFAMTYVFKYADPEPTYAPQARQVLIFDGFLAQGRADAPTVTTLTGFTLVAGTRRLGVGIIEGDQGIGGDQVIANGTALTEPRITPATTTNYNASTTDGASNPSYPNTYGLDAKTRDVPASVLPCGSTSIPITFTTSGDQYFPFLFAFSAPVVTNFLSGTVWNDADGDGVLDAGEAGIAGTTMTLTGTDAAGGAVTRTTTTDANGSYRFDGIANGTYTVTETQPSAFANSPGTTTTQYVSNSRTPFTYTGTTPTGVTNVNFAEIQSQIGGLVYHDQDADGVKDASEPGIAGVTMQLTGTDVNGAPVGLSTTTAADGTYSFVNLVPGTYVVTELQPSGWGDGVDVAGPAGGTVSNDKIEAIALGAGAVATGYNFGEKKAPLSGVVYVDTNNDGIRGTATAEPGIAGVIITVTGVTEAGVAVNMTTTSAAGGAWSFPGLLPGTYTVTETQPAQWGNGLDTLGTVNGTTVGSTTDDVFTDVVLTGAGAGINYNFGERPATVSGTVWYDVNGDSIKDATETTGLAGTVLTLTGTDSAGNAVSLTTTTAANGTYTFTNVPAGTNYTITETQPTGYGSSLNGTAITALTVPAGADVINKNFGETLGSISGKVYNDSVNDNVFTAGESGISGVTVTLTKPGGATVVTTTDSVWQLHLYGSASGYIHRDGNPASRFDRRRRNRWQLRR